VFFFVLKYNIHELQTYTAVGIELVKLATADCYVTIVFSYH